MRIKRFQARTFREALDLVKREMGQDAVILSTEERKGPPPGVEVAAAVDYDRLDDLANGASRAPESAPVPSPPPAACSRDGCGVTRAELACLTESIIGAVRAEFASMRSLVESEREPAGSAACGPARDVLRFLERRGVRREHAARLCRGSASPRDVLKKLAAEIAVRGEDPAGRRAIMLVGPTGSGKTTTVAKLAAAAGRAGRKAAVVTLDTYRIGAVEQARIYARALGIPLEVARSAGEVAAAVGRLADRDAVFIDTTGRNPSTGAFLQELAPVYESGLPVETHLVLCANSDHEFLEAACRRYGRLPIDCVGITKADEMPRPGAIFNIMALCRKPIAYVTTGQTVPTDIEFPTRERLAAMILAREPFPAAAGTVA